MARRPIPAKERTPDWYVNQRAAALRVLREATEPMTLTELLKRAGGNPEDIQQRHGMIYTLTRLEERDLVVCTLRPGKPLPTLYFEASRL